MIVIVVITVGVIVIVIGFHAVVGCCPPCDLSRVVGIGERLKALLINRSLGYNF